MDISSPLHIPPEIIPEGLVYHWGRFSCLGEPDLSHQVELFEKGWTIVPLSRHPYFLDKSISKEHIEVLEGLVLLERSSKLSDEEWLSK